MRIKVESLVKGQGNLSFCFVVDESKRVTDVCYGAEAALVGYTELSRSALD